MDSMVNGKKIGIIIQARTNSTRLPNKVLLKLPYDSQTCLLQQIIMRAKAVKNVDCIIVATSKGQENNVIERIVLGENVYVYRGSEDDVLERFYQASALHNLDVIVRLTGDNPFVDPGILEDVIKESIIENADYTTTKNLPIGCNPEIISFKALSEAFIKAYDPRDREHVTLYVKNESRNFKSHFQTYKEKQGSKDWRLTVDTESDYALACSIFKELYHQNALFGLSDIISLVEKNPWMLLINKHNIQKKTYNNTEEEVFDSIKLLRNQELNAAAFVLENFLKNSK